MHGVLMLESRWMIIHRAREKRQYMIFGVWDKISTLSGRKPQCKNLTGKTSFYVTSQNATGTF